jgi:transcriptional antiterminator RfaH
MPLLPLEPYLFPEQLFEPAASADDDDKRWIVLHTRPRAEKSLARQLLARRVPFFLPLFHKQWRSNGRTQSSYLPLFPGYVFLHGDNTARVEALTTNLIVNVLPVADQAGLYTDLTRVHRLMEGGSTLTPEQRVVPGTIVEITAGPLAGLEGKVLSRGKKFHFVIEVRLLQQGVSVEIESWMFQPLQGRPLALGAPTSVS